MLDFLKFIFGLYKTWNFQHKSFSSSRTATCFFVINLNILIHFIVSHFYQIIYLFTHQLIYPSTCYYSLSLYELNNCCIPDGRRFSIPRHWRELNLCLQCCIIRFWIIKHSTGLLVAAHISILCVPLSMTAYFEYQHS